MTQLALDLSHRTSLQGEDFFVSASNRAAVEVIDQWPDWPYFAYALIGPEASGKTHLASVWQEKSGALRIAGAELETADIAELPLGRALVLDDTGGVVREEALFHLLNWVREGEGQILLTAREPLRRLGFSLPDLISRLGAIPSVSLAAPDDELLGALMAKLFADRQIAVDAAVARYVLARIERSCAAVRDAVAALDSASLASGRRITVPLARKVLESLTN